MKKSKTKKKIKKEIISNETSPIDETLISTKLGFTKMNVRLNVDYNISDGYWL